MKWVDAIGPRPLRQKALSVVIGTGWSFRPYARVGVEIFGMQHAGALGDRQTASNPADDVGNFRSVGAALVFR
jgi:hypothetical protein